MINKKPVAIGLAVGLLCMTAFASTGLIQIPKTEFSPNETIQVQFEAPTNMSKTAWIGVVPSNVPHINESVNDQNNLAFEYMITPSGTLFLNAPKQPGAYDLRMNDNDLINGKEVASISFVVVEDSMLNKSKYVVPIANESSNAILTPNKSIEEISRANKSTEANVVRTLEATALAEQSKSYGARQARNNETSLSPKNGSALPSDGIARNMLNETKKANKTKTTSNLNVKINMTGPPFGSEGIHKIFP